MKPFMNTQQKRDTKETWLIKMMYRTVDRCYAVTHDDPKVKKCRQELNRRLKEGASKNEINKIQVKLKERIVALSIFNGTLNRLNRFNKQWAIREIYGINRNVH